MGLRQVRHLAGRADLLEDAPWRHLRALRDGAEPAGPQSLESGAALGRAAAMNLLAPLPPELQNPLAQLLIVREHGDQPGRIRLGGVEAVFLDVLDDARRFLAADAEEIGEFAAADALLLAKLFEP